MRKTKQQKVTYQTLYPKLWGSPIFNHPRSFWDDSYGIEMEHHPAGKMVVFGIPKSGNVWIMSLLVDYFGLSPIEPMYDVTSSGVGMTHRPFDEHIGNRADFLHGVCIIRDIRDVVASFYAYTQTKHFRESRPEYHYDDLVSFYFDWFLSRIAPAHKLLTHSERYARLGVPIIRYERLRASTISEFSRLLLRWGFAPDSLRVEEAVANNTIDKLREHGKQLEREIPSEHFRRGGVGTYKEELTDSIIKDIEHRFARTLLRWGYMDNAHQ